LKYTGVDGSICKCILQAKTTGQIGGGVMCNLNVKIHNPQTDLCNEIKRIGYIRDRESPVELRIGDTLILYMSTSVA
jgi:hypothetical protein